MTKRIAAVTLAAGVAVLILGGQALAAYPPGGPTVGASDTSVTPGQVITVSGTKWLAGSLVRIFFDGQFVGSATANGFGGFSTQITIPSSATAGPHSLVFRGFNRAGNPAVRTIVLTVVIGGGGGLAFTGANVAVWMVLVPVLLILGLASLLLGRRRRSPKKVGAGAR